MKTQTHRDEVSVCPSACIPAPAPESLPAMDNAIFMPVDLNQHALSVYRGSEDTWNLNMLIH